MSFRLLPLTMTAAGVLLGLKLIEVAHGGGEVLRLFSAASVQAETTEPPPEDMPKKEEATGTTEESDKSDSKETAPEEKPAEEKKDEGEAKKEGADAEGEKKEGESRHTSKDDIKTSPLKGKVTKKPDMPPPGTGVTLSDQPRYFSPVELEILQSLQSRREQLDTWRRELEEKETLLAAVEQRIDTKIAGMETMKQELKDMVVQYNTQEDAKIKSLVKVYEAMKPKDAARIFDEVDMPILLLVIDKMAEKKVAPILAAMDAKKAKQLTVELADQRRTQAPTASAAQAAASTPPQAKAP